MPRSGRGSKKRTTAGDDPPGKETEVVVDITPALPARGQGSPLETDRCSTEKASGVTYNTEAEGHDIVITTRSKVRIRSVAPP